MKINHLILFIIPVLASYACTNYEDSDQKTSMNIVTVEELKKDIIAIDDSLMMLTKKKMKNPNFKIDRLVYHEGINRNKKFFELFPENEYTKTALEKIASLYFQLQIEEEAAKWRDSIFLYYPNTESKIGLLEMQMSYYDYDNYNREKLEYYLKKLLNIENLSEEKKKDYEFRLKHIDKKHSELIEMHNNDSIQIEVIQ
jgi:predicted small secreted protein